MKNVYHYANFRVFLRDYYHHKKALGGGFSFRRFAKDADVLAPNYLKLVIDGKRALTDGFIFKFAEGLGLDYFETQYFECLVHFNQATEKRERDYYSERIKELRANVPKAGVGMVNRRMDFKWYVPLVRLLVDEKPTESAEKLVIEHFGSKLPINKIIADLLREGSLAIEEGRYVLRERFTQYRDKSGTKVSFENYTRAHLTFMQQNFKELYPKGRFVCHSFSVGRNRLEFYSALISAFILEINKYAEDEPSDQLLQLNMQLYPFKGNLEG